MPSRWTCIYFICCLYGQSISPTKGQPLHLYTGWTSSPSYLAFGNLTVSPTSSISPPPPPIFLFTYTYTLILSSLKYPPLTTQAYPIIALSCHSPHFFPLHSVPKPFQCSLDSTPPLRLLISRLPVTTILLSLIFLWLLCYHVLLPHGPSSSST